MHIAMKNENPALEKYAELMIEKIKEVHSSNWTKPWFTSQFKGLPQNLTGRAYSNQNKVMLYLICDKYKYKTPVFITFNQARNEKIQVLKGAKSFPVSFYDLIIKNKVTGRQVTRDFYNGLSTVEQEKYKVIPYLKYYNVFNLDQTNYSEAYPEKWNTLVKQFGLNPNSSNNFRNSLLDSTIEKQTWLCPIILKEQNNAFYRHSEDTITLPERYQFIDGKEFYYTALHEMAHSTGHPERLARKFGYNGTLQYAHEELIAELSSALAGRDLSFAILPRKENAQYLKSWLTSITDDPKYLFGILQDVNKAVTMIEEGIGLTKELEGAKVTPKETSIPVMTEDEDLTPKGDQSLKTDYGLEFRTVKEINPAWQVYDQTVAQTHLSQWGVIAIDKYGLPIDNEFDYEAIAQNLKIKTSNTLFNSEKISSIGIFSLKQGGIGISCKVNGIIQPYKKLDKKDISTLSSETDRVKLAQKYFSSEGTKSFIPISSTKKLYSFGSKTLLADVSPAPNHAPQVTNYRIFDKSTGKTESLNIGDIDLNKQQPESIKELLSGKQVKMTNKSGTNSLVTLNKTITGWGISAVKQVFNSADNSAGI